jgi:hypothetical protein
MIKKSETWDIQDSSKIQNFMDCQRSYFYRYILGWQSEYPNNHLVFGEAIHLALEYLLLNDYSTNSIAKAMDLFLLKYREYFDEGTDELFSPKTPARVVDLLIEYCEKYKNDKHDFDVLYTEVAGTVSLSEDRAIAFRQDAICRGEEGIFSLEHKTKGGSIDSRWQNQWYLKTQIGAYTHVLNCLYPDENIYGVKINGLGILKTKFSFERIPVVKTNKSMKVWLWNTLYWLDQIYWNIDLLLNNCKESDSVMMAFPLNSESCNKYFGCVYKDFCHAWANPLRRIDEVPPGFKIEYWNPLEKEARHKFEI